MKYTVALIEDNLRSRETTIEILTRDPRLEILVFENPRDFIMRDVKCDIIISDWRFGETLTLEFFLREIDRERLIIVSGSAYVLNVDCFAVIHKLDQAAKLLPLINFFTEQSRFSLQG